MNEIERIRREYQRRSLETPPDFYSRSKPANLFAVQQRARCCLSLLEKAGILPLREKRILDVGCGVGGWLADLESWGAQRANLAGIDLNESFVLKARRRLCEQRDEQGSLVAPGADIRLGDASHLPWTDASFDIVLQSTMFTSILDDGMKHAVAAEMMRVLKPGALIVWYDFLCNNPSNPNVRGVGKREIKALFPGCKVQLWRITLAPPLARRLVSWAWIPALLLEKLRFLNSHYLGMIEKPCGQKLFHDNTIPSTPALKTETGAAGHDSPGIADCCTNFRNDAS